MKSKIITIIGILGVTTTLFASANPEATFDNKCAACHMKTIPTDRANMIAPALNGVMRHVKMVYPNREDAVKFIVDYVQYPSKEKAICMAQKIARFGVMPSQKGNISPKELEDVSGWLFDNYPTANFRGQGMMWRMQNRSTFSAFDLNKDGAITKDEFLKVRTVKQEKRAGQGMLMRNAASAPSFESIDSNGDGKIKVNEFNRRR